jgi:hypothetical protein
MCLPTFPFHHYSFPVLGYLNGFAPLLIPFQSLTTDSPLPPYHNRLHTYVPIHSCITDHTLLLFEIVLCTGLPDTIESHLGLRIHNNPDHLVSTRNIEPDALLRDHLTCEGSDIDLDVLVSQEILRNTTMHHT